MKKKICKFVRFKQMVKTKSDFSNIHDLSNLEVQSRAQFHRAVKQRILLSKIKQTTSQNACILYETLAGNQINLVSNFYLLSSSMKLARLEQNIDFLLLIPIPSWCCCLICTLTILGFLLSCYFISFLLQLKCHFWNWELSDDFWIASCWCLCNAHVLRGIGAIGAKHLVFSISAECNFAFWMSINVIYSNIFHIRLKVIIF